MAQLFTEDQIIGTTNAAPLTATKTFYAAATSGGAVTVLNTVTISNGLIMTWTQTTPSGSPGEWKFNNAVNSGQVLTVGF